MSESVSLSVNNIVEYVSLSVNNITEVVTLSAMEVIERITLNVSNEVGPSGPGIAAGGTDGQILIKSGSIDYQTTWIDFDTLVDPVGSALSAQNFSIQRANHTGTQSASTITGLASVATTGSYDDLSGKPVLGTASTKDIEYFDLSGSATAAQNFSIQRANHTGTQSASTITGLASVATTGSYDDLTNKPIIPVAQVNSDWNSGSGVSQILNKPTFGTLAFQNGTFSGNSSGVNTGDQDLSGLLVKANNLSDIPNKPVARVNLGLGTAATQPASAFASSVEIIPGGSPDSFPFSQHRNFGLVSYQGDFDNGDYQQTFAALGNLQIYQALFATNVNDSRDALSLGNVNNTSDLNKPVSTAQALADSNVQSFSIQRANHTGTQSVSTITGLASVATTGLYSSLSGTPILANVATSGSYNDLINLPSIPAAQVNSDWNSVSGVSQILNKPTFGTAASRATEYFDLSGSATAAQNFSIQRANHTGTQSVSTITGLASVATTGSYDDLTNKPIIPDEQINADWDSASGVSQILNKPTFGTLAFQNGTFSGNSSGVNTGDQDLSGLQPLDTDLTAYANAVDAAARRALIGAEVVGAAAAVENKANLSQSTGLIDGGFLSIGTPNTTFSISDGRGIVTDSTVYPPAVTSVIWTGKTNIAATYLNTHLISFVGLDVSGNVVQSSTPFTNAQHRSIIVLGSIIHVNQTNLDAINQFGEIVINPTNQLSDLTNSLGKFNVSGNVFSANGANMLINKSLGYVHAEGSNWANSKINPNVITLASLSGLTFQYRFQNGTNGATGTAINPNIYDLAGVSTSVPINRFTIQRIYSFVSNNVKIQPGQTTYNSLAEAKAAIQTESFIVEPSIEANGILRAFLIVQQGTTSLQTSTRAFFYEAGKFGSQIGVGGQSVSSLQNAYDNAISPEIITSSTNGSVSIKRGSAADTDSVLEVLNGAGTTTFSVKGNGLVVGNLSGGMNTVWIGLVLGCSPTGPVSVAGGVVYTYNYGVTTYYRFISTNGLTDTFYAGFDGINLTNIVATKTLSF